MHPSYTVGRGGMTGLIVFGAVFVVGLPAANALVSCRDYYLNLFGKYLAQASPPLGLDDPATVIALLNPTGGLVGGDAWTSR